MADPAIKAPDIIATGTLNGQITKAGTNIANLMLYLAGAIAVGSLIGYGITLITASGDESKIAAAKKGITYSVLGVILITLSLVMVNLITSAVAIS